MSQISSSSSSVMELQEADACDRLTGDVIVTGDVTMLDMEPVAAELLT